MSICIYQLRSCSVNPITGLTKARFRALVPRHPDRGFSLGADRASLRNRTREAVRTHFCRAMIAWGSQSRSFLRGWGYSLLLQAAIPIAISCPLFEEEVIYVLVEAKCGPDSIRLLAPSLVFALANPLSWLIMATRRGRTQSASLRHIGPDYSLVKARERDCSWGLLAT